MDESPVKEYSWIAAVVLGTVHVFRMIRDVILKRTPPAEAELGVKERSDNAAIDVLKAQVTTLRMQNQELQRDVHAQAVEIRRLERENNTLQARLDAASEPIAELLAQITQLQADRA